MKILAVGDLHIRQQRPKSRTDDYFKTQYGKIEWILRYYKEHNCNLLLIPGDLFDSPFTPYSVFQQYLKLFKTWNPKAIAIWGQHDLRYRVSKDNTPMKAFNAAGVITVPEENYVMTPNNGINIKWLDQNVHVYGGSFGEPIFEPISLDKFNILLVHKMIVNETPLWEAQEEYTKASSLLKQYNYDLIVSGDNHTFFISEYKGKTLINCGSLMRSTIAQKDHIPKIVVYDTDTRKYEIISVPIQPIEEVMNLEAVETEKQTDEKLAAFVRGLSDYRETGLDFMRNLDKRIKEDNITEDIRNLILECAEEQA